MKVLILGLGQYPQGSGIAAALYFAQRGDDVTATDLKSAEDLKENVAQLKKFKNVRLVLGHHDIKDVREADLIVRNPRVRSDSAEIVEAKKLGIPVESDISIFLSHCPAHVIGITGTRGKSTTSALIAEMLKNGSNSSQPPLSKRGGASEGFEPPLLRKRGQGALERQVFLGGNILVSPLTFLSDVKKDDWVVLELSSWQLEITGENNISPPVAVWTNLMRDHLNTYSGMEEYAEAKAQIFRHQKPEGLVFLPSDESFDIFADSAPGQVIRFGKKDDKAAQIVQSVKLKMIGEHNITNAVIATTVALELGVPVSAVKKVLKSFPGLPNRLELVGTVNGVKYINDTTATTPDATIAALRSFCHTRGGGYPAPTPRLDSRLHGNDKPRIHLIFGGADKELEFDEVAAVLKRATVNMYLFPGTAHEKIVKAFHAHHVEFKDVKDMKDVMQTIKKIAKKGDVVLLSPGCASFGLFKNEFDRGEQFKALVG